MPEPIPSDPRRSSHPVLGENVILVLRGVVAGEPALGVVSLRWLVFQRVGIAETLISLRASAASPKTSTSSGAISAASRSARMFSSVDRASRKVNNSRRSDEDINPSRQFLCSPPLAREYACGVSGSRTHKKLRADVAGTAANASLKALCISRHHKHPYRPFDMLLSWSGVAFRIPPPRRQTQSMGTHPKNAIYGGKGV
jgi:hypothetical protein